MFRDHLVQSLQKLWWEAIVAGDPTDWKREGGFMFLAVYLATLCVAVALFK